MTDLEQKLNSGKVYQVIAQENQDPRFYEYLEKMEKYNTLGYTERAEKEKQQILKSCLRKLETIPTFRHRIMRCGEAGMSTLEKTYISILTALLSMTHRSISEMIR